ncbi:MAG: DoxX family protein [Planctomycetota bacterium]
MAPSNDNLFRRFDQSGFLLVIVRAALGGTFVWMGANKIADPISFMKAIRLYGMMPDTPGIYLNVTAIVVPWIEVVAGTALLLGMQVRGAALAIAVMLAVFTPAVLLRSLEIMRETGQSFFQLAFDCGCGTGVEVIWRKMLMNFSLFVLAVIALCSGSRRFCATLWFERRKPNAAFCHLCGYAVKCLARNGLCERCSTPPAIPDAAAESTG